MLALGALSIWAAHAAEPTGTLALACNGTRTNQHEGSTGTQNFYDEPEPYSVGIIIDFTARTVVGLDLPAKVSSITELTLSFSADDWEMNESIWKINGTINRVTGDVDATWTARHKKTRKIIIGTYYSLKCKPTQRVF